MKRVHGSRWGYRQHRQLGEDACPACLAALAAFNRERRSMYRYPVRHLDLDALILYVEKREGPSGNPFSEGQVRDGRVLTDIQVANACGLPPGTIHKWRSRGGVPLFSADQVATHFGVHLLELWPDAYDDIDTEEAA